jgi:hypothetical protein
MESDLYQLNRAAFFLGAKFCIMATQKRSHYDSYKGFFGGKKWPKGNQILRELVLKSSNLDNRFQHVVAKIWQDS